MINEQQIQDLFLVPFLRESLGWREVRANTVAPGSLVIEEDLAEFLSTSKLNEANYRHLVKKLGSEKAVLKEVIQVIHDRSAMARNMAVFLNTNKKVLVQGYELYLFHVSNSVLHEDQHFAENIFSVVQELPYKVSYGGHLVFSFRPDLTFFVNGIYLGYCELKCNFTGQSAKKNGRGKVIKDYLTAVEVLHRVLADNPHFIESDERRVRRDLLKVFERAISVSTTDLKDTYVIRNLADFGTEYLRQRKEGSKDRTTIEKEMTKAFYAYPLKNPQGTRPERLAEAFAAHYGRLAVEKEILYYNFIERGTETVDGRRTTKDEEGRLISPRPKQKFGTDKILGRVEELLDHEADPDYLQKRLEAQLAGVSAAKRKELLEKRQRYLNNKNVYSLLLQYAAGFGKSNIIGWTALQLKDLRREGAFIFDKVMLVVDRLELRGQLDAKLLNMNIDNSLYVEASNRQQFVAAISDQRRVVIVNIQKFGALREMLDPSVLAQLTSLRLAFLIDEIHRSNSGEQHEEMMSLFDELQSAFDADPSYTGQSHKKNLIIGFTATPDDHTLARFGEFSGYAEAEKLWVPFDSYTMSQAIADGFILNPLANLVPVGSKMLFALPHHVLAGFEAQKLKDASKKQIYENPERIDAISQYVAGLLVKDVYRQIRGQGKAMLACFSIDAAIQYRAKVEVHFQRLVAEPRYSRYADAPIYIVYSDSQDKEAASTLNGGLSEKRVLEEFSRRKNGLIIVVAKLQTGYDEKKLHTLFLDKEVKGIGAIQAISRVNRTMRYKDDCKVVDFSFENVNVGNIKKAFEHFSDVVVSDFDPFGEAKLLEQVYGLLKQSEVFGEYFERHKALDAQWATDPQSSLFFDLEASLEKFIQTHERSTADAKARASQFFTILRKIEYVIELDSKLSDRSFLEFWGFFNEVYLRLNATEDARDPIIVYFDNQIGLIETPKIKDQKSKKKQLKVAEAGEPRPPLQYSILELIEERNAGQTIVAESIQSFEKKITDFFEWILADPDGKRLVAKIRSHSPEEEVQEAFGPVFRKYKAIKRAALGEYFFSELEALFGTLTLNFVEYVRVRAEPGRGLAQ